MTVQRRASWVCRACPPDGQVLRSGPHYVDRGLAETGLRTHFLCEHADLLWNPATREQVAGDVLDYLPADA